MGALSVVYTGLPARSFDDIIKEQFDDKNLFFYQSYFREPGRAEAIFDPDPRDFLRKFFYIASGDVDLAAISGAFRSRMQPPRSWTACPTRIRSRRG